MSREVRDRTGLLVCGLLAITFAGYMRESVPPPRVPNKLTAPKGEAVIKTSPGADDSG